MKHYAVLLAALLCGAPVAYGAAPVGDGGATLNVDCTRESAFLSILVVNEKRIGHVVLEIRDQQGRVLYREEGKALTGELVRRLDKGQLPRGKHTLSVRAKELALSQEFIVE